MTRAVVRIEDAFDAYSSMNPRLGRLPSYMTMSSVTGSAEFTTLQVTIDSLQAGFVPTSTDAAMAIYQAVSSDRFSVSFLE